MKPAAIAATLLLHTVTLGTFYHFSSEPAAHMGQPTLAVTVLQDGGSKTTFNNQRALAAASRLPTDSSDASANDAGASDMTAVSIPANYAAANQKPVYPILSRKQAEQGTVILRILVKTDGTPGDVRIQQSSGYPLLDESALSTVKQWRFHPASINRHPIAEWYQVAIPFKLQK